MNLLIREATPDDAAGVVAVLNPIIEAGVFTALATPFTVEEERAFIAGLGARSIFHVAVRDDDQVIVGLQDIGPFATYTSAFDHVGVIGTFVDLAWRRRGVAKALFRATFEAARRKGYEKIFTYIRADNAAALATYESQGFRTAGRAARHAKLDGLYVDEVFMERFL